MKTSPWKKIKKCKYLYIMMLLPIIYYILFHYLPLYGVLIAFKDYKIAKGVWGSPWVGFKWFQKFLTDPYFWKLVKNTLLLNIYGLLWGFPVPILLALMLNEVTNAKFKRVIQTVSYLPHFISTVVVCGMVMIARMVPYHIYGIRYLADLWMDFHYLSVGTDLCGPGDPGGGNDRWSEPFPEYQIGDTSLYCTDHLHYADHADWTTDVSGI